MISFISTVMDIIYWDNFGPPSHTVWALCLGPIYPHHWGFGSWLIITHCLSHISCPWLSHMELEVLW